MNVLGILLLIGTTLFYLGLPIFLLFRVISQQTRIRKLEHGIDALKKEVSGLKDLKPETKPVTPEPPQPAAATRQETVDRERAPAAADRPSPLPAPAERIGRGTAPPPPRSALAAEKQSLETHLTGRWLVWLGAVTIALGGIFLVKYGIDQGLLSPLVRVCLGLTAGVALIAAGEWVRRRPWPVIPGYPDQTAPALASAGVVVCYGSVYAGQALHDLFPAVIAFIALAGVSLAAIVLALRHGPLIGAIGVVGGYATPILIQTDTSSAAMLFSYLLFVGAAGLGITRFRGWREHSVVSVGGLAAWPYLWLISNANPDDTITLGLYFAVALTLCFVLRYDDDDRRPIGIRHLGHVDARGLRLVRLWRLIAGGRVMMAIERLTPMDVSLYGLALSGLATLLFVAKRDMYTPESIFAVLFLLAVLMAIALRDAVYDLLTVIAGIGATVFLARWAPFSVSDDFIPLEALRWLVAGLDVPPPTLSAFILGAAILVALFGPGTFLAGRHAVRPVLWALVTSATTITLMVIAYWRLGDFLSKDFWTLIGVILAGLGVAATTATAGRIPRVASSATGLYAAATVAALALTASILFSQAWLTVGFALLLMGLAILERWYPFPLLRFVALIVAVIVIVRLVLNPNIIDYPVEWQGMIHWTLYGYGLPAALFAYAAWRFDRIQRDLLVSILTLGTAVFAILLIFLEIRIILSGSINGRPYELIEASLHTLIWMAGAIVLARLSARLGFEMLRWLGGLLMYLAAGQGVVVHFLTLNPLLSPISVGSWPILNTLLLAYAVPGVTLIAASIADRSLFPWLADRFRRPIGLIGLALLLVWALLSIRHAFVGPILSQAPVSQGESYAYSAALLLFAIGILVLGIARHAFLLRHVGLAVLLIAVVKVFAIDMSALAGLYRVMSFFGLGLGLVGVGYLYRRFVLTAAPAPGASDRSTESTDTQAP